MLLGCVSIAKYSDFHDQSLLASRLSIGRHVPSPCSVGRSGRICRDVYCLMLCGRVVFVQHKTFHFDGLLGMLTNNLEWLTNIFGVAAAVFLSWLLFPSHRIGDCELFSGRRGGRGGGETLS